MKKLTLAILLLLATPAFAQNVRQSGTVTRGHVPMWTTDGIIQDGGTAAQGFLTSLGVTNNGGPGVCINSAVITAPYTRLCLSATTNGGTRISSYALGGSTSAALTFDINGTVYDFPAPPTVDGYFNVLSYGADRTGNANSLTAFRLALAAAVAAGGGTIRVPCGSYTLLDNSTDAALIAMTTDGISWLGDGVCSKLNLFSSAVTKFGFSWIGSFSSTTYTLASPPTVGDHSIVLTTTTGLAAGDWLQFTGLDSDGHTLLTYLKIKSIAGTTVNIAGSLPFTIDSASPTYDIRLANAFMKGGGMQNMLVDCTGMTGSGGFIHGVSALRTQSQIYDHLEFRHCQGGSPTTASATSFHMQSGFKNTVGRIISEEGGSLGLTDPRFIYQAYLHVGSSTTFNTPAFGSGLWVSTDSHIGTMAVYGGGVRGFKMSGAVRNHIGNVKLNGTLSALFFENGSKNNIVSAANTDDNQEGIYFSATGNTGNIISAAHSFNNSSLDLLVFSPDTNNVIGHTLVSSFAKVSLVPYVAVGPIRSTGDSATTLYNIVNCATGIRSSSVGLFSCIP